LDTNTHSGSKNIADAIAKSREVHGIALIPYVTVGFPTLEDTVPIVVELEKAGASIVELGVPYSDALADGPTIQSASYRALGNGVTSKTCIDIVKDIRKAGVKLPLIFMGYYNPILSFGIQEYALECSKAGLQGLIIPDLPPEEADLMHQSLKSYGLALISLLAPTSSSERILKACAGANGFIYCVSVAGITGLRSELPADLKVFIDRVREKTSLPLGVGFGVSQRSHVQALSSLVECAIVGTQMINVIDSSPPNSRSYNAGNYVRELLGIS
tara:strand:- start:4171 stop:4986 length:816 start_codon:yes stop_codon:yes gene_type:complete